MDSIAALAPKAELEGDIGDPFVGLQVRLSSQALRKLAGPVHRSGAGVVFISQVRQRVGALHGSPEVTSGGRTLKFYASVRLEIHLTETSRPATRFWGSAST